MQTMDQKIYKILVEQGKLLLHTDQNRDPNSATPAEYGPGFIMHLVFKVIPIALMWLRGILAPFITKTIVIELILLFVVIDFWLTKNVTGKKMIGMKWGFEEN